MTFPDGNHRCIELSQSITTEFRISPTEQRRGIYVDKNRINVIRDRLILANMKKENRGENDKPLPVYHRGKILHREYRLIVCTRYYQEHAA